MDFKLLSEWPWWFLALPLIFALGWWASRLDMLQWRREQKESAKAFYLGLNLLLNEQHDKAIDALILALQSDPDTADLHFALGNLFRRRGEYERAVRVHEHLLSRADLAQSERDRAQHALAQDYLTAGILDRAEVAFKALEGTAFDTEARLALLNLFERSRQWNAAIDAATRLEHTGAGSFATRIAHYWCELALEADLRHEFESATQLVQRAREAAPQAARPSVLAGARAFSQAKQALALQNWGLLLPIHPLAFNLIAQDYAQCALQQGTPETHHPDLHKAHPAGRIDDDRTGQADLNDAGAFCVNPAQAALATIKELYQRMPSTPLLQALHLLEPDLHQQRQRLLQRLQEPGAVSTAHMLLAQPGLVNEAEQAAIAQALAPTAQALQRFRCAACAFEAQHYFWQCPGCLGWDTYPPQYLEDL
jgi:lipopolysaccharide assembly protein B